MERKIIKKIEPYMSVDFYEEEDENEDYEETPFSMIMDLSSMRPGELEIEDEIKRGYLWKKYKKNPKWNSN